MASGNPYAKGGPLAFLIEGIVTANAWAAREPALKLFTKIVTNILANPSEPKYRRLNVEKVIGKFGADFRGIADLLRRIGFVADGANLVLPETAPTLPLAQTLEVWTERETRYAAARADAERVRLANMAEYSKDKAAKDASRAQLRSLGGEARKNVADRPVNSSVGNAIKFGSTLVKAPPPPPPAKGG